jgi:protein-S-isoprenylcysteine O-methyltransferase Ste14
MALEPNLRPPALAIGTLLSAIVVGAVFGAITAQETEHAWPPQAAQVLVTLLVAGAVEQYTLPRHITGWTGVLLAAVLALGVLLALIACVISASDGEGFTALEAGLVNGGLASLGLVVVVGLLWRVWPNPGP